jgi:hypothetical protein
LLKQSEQALFKAYPTEGVKGSLPIEAESAVGVIHESGTSQFLWAIVIWGLPKE